MIYVITEDSNSGAEIWNLIMTNQHLSHQIIPSQGAHHMQTIISNFIQQHIGELTHTDMVILAYDMANPHYVKGILHYQQQIAINCNCYVTAYLCIEEVFLRLPQLYSWIPRNKLTPSTLATWDFFCALSNDKLQEFWNSAAEYSSRMQEFYSTSSNPHKTDSQMSACLIDRHEYPTLERALASLLSRVTYKTALGCPKSRVGKCWQTDCCWDIYKTNQTTPHCMLIDHLTIAQKTAFLVESPAFCNNILTSSGGRTSLSTILRHQTLMRPECKQCTLSQKNDQQPEPLLNSHIDHGASIETKIPKQI